MSEEMTGINREAVYKTLIEGLKKEKPMYSFHSSIVNTRSKTSAPCSSVEFAGMNDNRHILKGVVRGTKVSVSCTI
jgi:hypothetical protein